MAGMLDRALDMEGRYSLLPLQDTPQGRQWALPGMLAGAWNAFTAPGRAWSGQLDPSSPEAVQEALNLAGYASIADLPSVVAGARATPGMLGANVYHGSPYSFDRFDAAHIGKGEGAQAYGHGLYLADSPKVGDTYREMLSVSGGIPMSGYNAVKARDPQLAADIAALVGDDSVRINRAVIKPTEVRDMPPALKARINAFKKDNRGYLYKADLPDEMISRMLDWDKPLSQQPESVRKILEPLAKETNISRGFGQNSTGDIINAARRLGMNPEQALLDAGIPGIRYLDQGSRAAGAGTSNYVVFPGEEGALKILERNGKPVKP